MKHIFVVHSNLTYLSALATADLLGIATNDMLIVSQNYRREFPIRVVPLKLFTRNILRPSRFFNFAWHTDHMIEQFAKGEDFDLYIPAMTKPAKLFTTNVQCRSVSFIEEGIGSYMRQFPAENHTYEYRTLSTRPSMSRSYIKGTLLSLMNLLRGESQLLTSMPMNYTSYAGNPGYSFYGFHPAVFPLAPSQHLISMQSLSQRFEALRTLDLSGKYILVGEGLFSLVAGYTLDEYIIVLNDTVVPWLRDRGVRELLIKHHYNESAESKTRSTEAFLSTGIAVTIIPDTVILETELIGSENVTLIGCSSSLLFYAALMGCNAHSYASYIDHPLLDMAAYWQHVKLI